MSYGADMAQVPYSISLMNNAIEDFFPVQALTWGCAIKGLDAVFCCNL